jgi:hypothetical protein
MAFSTLEELGEKGRSAFYYMTVELAVRPQLLANGEPDNAEEIYWANKRWLDTNNEIREGRYRK